jgi:hypothetical protein
MQSASSLVVWIAQLIEGQPVPTQLFAHSETRKPDMQARGTQQTLL